MERFEPSLGAHLARSEATEALRRLFDRIGRLEMTVDRGDIKWTPDFVLRGAAAIPVNRT